MAGEESFQPITDGNSRHSCLVPCFKRKDFKIKILIYFVYFMSLCNAFSASIEIISCFLFIYKCGELKEQILLL